MKKLFYIIAITSLLLKTNIESVIKPSASKYRTVEKKEDVNELVKYLISQDIKEPKNLDPYNQIQKKFLSIKQKLEELESKQNKIKTIRNQHLRDLSNLILESEEYKENNNLFLDLIDELKTTYHIYN